MRQEIRYIELKSGFGDNGPAWIGLVECYKSGQTIYFNDTALKKLKSPGVSGNHFDIETGEEYWISGVKKNGQDRHYAGGGKVMIDEEIISDYLNLVDFDIIDKKNFDIINIEKGTRLDLTILKTKKEKFQFLNLGNIISGTGIIIGGIS